MAEFIFRFPEISELWHNQSNYILCLSAKDEESLIVLASKFEAEGLKYVLFREPDIADQVTAIAVEPSDKTKRLCSNLPLALKEFSQAGINKNNFEKVTI